MAGIPGGILNHDQPHLEVSIDVDADPARVWAEVTDRRAMARRSPELVRMWLFGDQVAGARGVSLNRRKGLVWPTTTRVLQVKAPTGGETGIFEFRVGPAQVVWTYEVAPGEAGGTHLVERRSALQDPGRVVWWMARYGLGGEDQHHAELEAGMRTTLAGIKADVER